MARPPPSFNNQIPQPQSTMANKPDRVWEMSKQAEILLKRKQEIERQLREGSVPETAKTGVPPPKSQPSRPVINIKSNKFANDGSFFKQFKEMVQKSDDKSQSNEVRNEKNRIPISSVFERDEEPPKKVAKKDHHSEIDTDEPVQNKTEDPEMQQEWFQDALRRAKEKAKTLSNPGGVSLSAQPIDAAAATSTSGSLVGGGGSGFGGGGCYGSDSSSSSSSNEEALARKLRRSRWAEEAGMPTQIQGGIPVPGVVIPAGVGVTAGMVLPKPVMPAMVAPITPNGSFNVPLPFMNMINEGEHIDAIRGVMVTKMTRHNPAIIAYAQRVFGSLDLSEGQWKQCEEQMKMNVVFQLLQEKKKEADRLAQQGRVKYEYDSDEETEGGTWEHKRRATEMSETAYVAEQLTEDAEGKHHIGDYLPPEELARFMEKFHALKEGRDPDLSQYHENRLTEDNVGYRMLKSMGWTEGMGLGSQGTGIINPVSANGRSENQGLGLDRPDNLDIDDTEFDAYRKRMMLAYRFRPNPLNNPRRQYY